MCTECFPTTRQYNNLEKRQAANGDRVDEREEGVIITSEEVITNICPSGSIDGQQSYYLGEKSRHTNKIARARRSTVTKLS
jgi:hypothetical protein